MTVVGQISLLVSFAGSGYAAFACIWGARTDREMLRRAGQWAGTMSVIALTVGLMVLGHALYTKDFDFAYVAQYSSRLLPWHYSLSALWVGQAGSLLLWAWMLGLLALLFRRRAIRRSLKAEAGEDGLNCEGERLSEVTFGLLMAYLCFLTGTMVFAADPMEPSVTHSSEGHGLSPLLQHPAMLVHPPVVFLGYAGWAIPCGLTIAALACGGLDRNWLQQVRPWASFAWAVLGIGILLGAYWSYQELGWGGYWAWDPVENASLIPWLTGTAFLHTLMAWRFRGVLKKTVVALAIATFGLCNFATFLTRSGIFSSLHAFSRSPIGWLFLGLMIGLGTTAGLLIFARRAQLAPERRIASLLSCEAMVLLSTVALVLLASVVIVGTLFVALSEAVVGRRIVVGPEFYNSGLISCGLVLLAAMAPAPLLQWGCAPCRARKKILLASAVLATLGAGLFLGSGPQHPLSVGMIWFALCASAAIAGRILLDIHLHLPQRLWNRVSIALRTSRRKYAGFVAHLGFFCLVVGVAGSSLGSIRREFDIDEGATVRWADRSIQFSRLNRSNESDKVVVEAELVISPDRGESYTLRPAQHLHRLQGTWTTEAAIHSLWSEDFYTILHYGEGIQAHFTFVLNPLLRWIWVGGCVIGFGALVGLIPERRPQSKTSEGRSIVQAQPHRTRANHAAWREGSSHSLPARD